MVAKTPGASRIILGKVTPLIPYAVGEQPYGTRFYQRPLARPTLWQNFLAINRRKSEVPILQAQGYFKWHAHCQLSAAEVSDEKDNGIPHGGCDSDGDGDTGFQPGSRSSSGDRRLRPDCEGESAVRPRFLSTAV